MDRKVLEVSSLSLSFSLSLCFSLFLSLSLSFSLFLSLSLTIDLPTYLPIYLSTYLSIYPSIHLSIYLSIDPSIHPSLCLSVSLSVCLSTCLSASLKTKLLCLTTSKTPQFCETSSMFRQKRTNSARLRHFSKLTTSKMKQFCETSSIFQLDNSKSGANTWCFVHFDFEMCFAPQRRALFRHLNFQKWELACFVHFDFEMCFAPQRRTFSTAQLLKVLRSWGVLYILTSKCASRHNDVDFFNSTTPKSAPKLRCFVHFDLEMCFAPHWRAIFHLSSG